MTDLDDRAWLEDDEEADEQEAAQPAVIERAASRQHTWAGQ